jgi:hypothetical protein
MKHLGLILLALAGLSAAGQAKPQTFVGVITDEMCAKGDHSRMQMGPTDAECTRACVAVHGSQYVLYDGKGVWVLSDQETPDKFAGQKVQVVGTPDAKNGRIRVDSITAAR